MSEVAKTYREQLDRIKKEITKVRTAWADNYNRYHLYRDFIFNSSISQSEAALIEAMGKPVIQANVLEAYLSRGCAERDAQEPSIYCYNKAGEPLDEEKVSFLQGYCKRKLYEVKRNNTQFKTFQEQMSGGFAVFEIYTDYLNRNKFEQDIFFRKSENPTLCGFDLMAEEPHKADGRFCFKIYPLTKDEFKQEFPHIDISTVNFSRSLGGFEWSYSSGREEIVLVCDWYEKEIKDIKIVQLADGQVMTKKEHKEFLEMWEMAGIIAQPPIVINERWTQKEIICCYRLYENAILKYYETEYPALPLIFVDGNSVVLQRGNGAYEQMTRSFFHHAMDTQRLKNFSMQCLADWLQSMVMHKFMAAEEGLPDQEDYLNAYRNIQKAALLVYKSSYNGTPIPPPREIAVAPAPPEIMQTFGETERAIQSILGSFDSTLGIFDKEISGKAISNGAMQSSAASRTFPINYNIALAQVFNVMIEMLPKYLREHNGKQRNVPIMTREGKMSYQKVGKGAMELDYEEDSLQIAIEVGVNYELQKMNNLEITNSAMAANPGFARFIAEDCLDIYVKNLVLKGDGDILEERAQQFQEKMVQERQQAMAMQQQQAQIAMQTNPAVLKAQNDKMKLMMDSKQNEIKNQLEAARIANEKQSIDNDFVEILVKSQSSQVDNATKVAKADAETARAAVERANAITRAHMDILKMMEAHKTNKAKLLHEIVSSDRKYSQSIKEDVLQ